MGPSGWVVSGDMDVWVLQGGGVSGDMDVWVLGGVGALTHGSFLGGWCVWGLGCPGVLWGGGGGLGEQVLGPFGVGGLWGCRCPGCFGVWGVIRGGEGGRCQCPLEGGCLELGVPPGWGGGGIPGGPGLWGPRPHPFPVSCPPPQTRHPEAGGAAAQTGRGHGAGGTAGVSQGPPLPGAQSPGQGAPSQSGTPGGLRGTGTRNRTPPGSPRTPSNHRRPRSPRGYPGGCGGPPGRGP